MGNYDIRFRMWLHCWQSRFSVFCQDECEYIEIYIVYIYTLYIFDTFLYIHIWYFVVSNTTKQHTYEEKMFYT